MLAHEKELLGFYVIDCETLEDAIAFAQLASGVYIYRILAKGATDTHTATGRMMLIK